MVYLQKSQKVSEKKCFSFIRKTIQYGERKEVGTTALGRVRKWGHGPVVSPAVETHLLLFLVALHPKKTIEM